MLKKDLSSRLKIAMLIVTCLQPSIDVAAITTTTNMKRIYHIVTSITIKIYMSLISSFFAYVTKEQ